MASKSRAVTSEPAPTGVPGKRVVSLDALRGFDMLWIVGGDSVVEALHKTTNNPATRFLAGQFTHTSWAGMTFYDLIFPLFLFIVGVSLVFSLSRTVEQSGRREAVKRIIRRGLLLVALGIFQYGGFSHPWPHIRLLGVLQRIGLCYLVTGLLFVFIRPRGLVAICVALLIGYWALLTFIPIRDIQLEEKALAAQGAPTPPGARAPDASALFYSTTRTTTGRYDKGLNLANHLDFQYLPGRLYNRYWDPEGLLSTLPAIATCLLGVFAGLLLRSGRVDPRRKIRYLLVGGLGALAIGYLWGIQFPVVKQIWTSTFVLLAGGYSALLLAAFYYIVDVQQHQGWCRPFIWIGTNAITVYVVENIVGFDSLAERLAGGSVNQFLDAHVTSGFGDLVVALLGISLAILFCRFLYLRGVFLRL